MKKNNRIGLTLRFSRDELMLIQVVAERFLGEKINNDVELKSVVKSIVMNTVKAGAKDLAEQAKREALQKTDKIAEELISTDRNLGKDSESNESGKSAGDSEATQLNANSYSNASADAQSSVVDSEGSN